MRNEPHVSRLFHLHAFFADSAQTGGWWIKAWPPTGDGAIVLSGSYETDQDGEWRSRDYSLGAGHYRLSWQDPPGANGKREEKHKVFWVDECETATPTPTPTPVATPTPTPTPVVTPTPTPTPGGGVGGTTATPTATPTSTPSGQTGGATSTPAGGVLGETGTPGATLPSTDTASVDTVPAPESWRLALPALAGILAGALLLTPSPKRIRR